MFYIREEIREPMIGGNGRERLHAGQHPLCRQDVPHVLTEDQVLQARLLMHLGKGMQDAELAMVQRRDRPLIGGGEAECPVTLNAQIDVHGVPLVAHAFVARISVHG